MNDRKPDGEPASVELSNEAIRWIVRLHSGTASAEDRKAFQTWRSSSIRHEQAAAEAEALWGGMSELHVDSRTGLVQPGNRRESGVSRRTLLVSLLCLGGAGSLGGAMWTSGILRRFSADYVSDIASPRIIELPDGSRAFLNAQSAIDLRFDDVRRRIILVEGQGYFEVAPDAQRPFEVMVDGISVTALGTAFDVNRNLPDARAEIAVSEHSVRVRSDAPSLTSAGDTVVEAGESVMVDRQGHIGRIVKRDLATMSAWRSGIYVAEDRPLEEVVSALAAYHRGMIAVNGEALKNLKVNAVLDLRDPIGSIDALQQGLPLSVRHISDFFIVISAR